MTTTTDRATELREQVADAEHRMGIHFATPHLYAQAIADRGNARRELRQMEEDR